MHPDDVPRLARLNVVASMQPIHATSDMLMADQYWGERTFYAYALKTQLDMGAHIAFGSVTRRRADGSPGPEGWHPEQRLSLQQAIEGFTTGAAYAAYTESRQGRLVPGSFADLIVLEKDPFTSDPAEVKDLQSSATMVGGDWVYEI
jgi:predicted amidohydrolase YtcJ